MRILHTADWHFGKTLEGRSRIEEQAEFMDELVDIVKEEQIDLLLIAGDVYDSVNPSAAAEQLFYDGLARLSDQGKRSIQVIAGNHDHPERLAAATPLTAQQNISILGMPQPVVQRVEVPRTGELACIFALPYPSESRLKELLSESNDEHALRQAYAERISEMVKQQAQQFSADSVNIIMSHVYVLGGKESDSERPIQVGGAYTLPASTFAGLAPYTALGHLHRPQTISASSTIRYSGSPLAYSFSEAGQAKSVTVFELSKDFQHRSDTLELREIYLRSGRPLVRWKAVEGISQVHSWLDEGKDKQAWIDLELNVQQSLTMEEIQQLRKLHPGIIHIRPIYPEFQVNEGSARSERLPLDEMFKQFYHRQTGGASPDPELVELFMQLVGETAEMEQEVNEA